MKARLRRLEHGARERREARRQAATEALAAWTFANVPEPERDGYFRWQLNLACWPAVAPSWLGQADAELLRQFADTLGPVRPGDRETFERVRAMLPAELVAARNSAWEVD